MPAKQEPNPYKLIQKLRLRPRPQPKHPIWKLGGPVSDYEIIMAQGFEIARLRRELDG